MSGRRYSRHLDPECVERARQKRIRDQGRNSKPYLSPGLVGLVPLPSSFPKNLNLIGKAASLLITGIVGAGLVLSPLADNASMEREEQPLTVDDANGIHGYYGQEMIDSCSTNQPYIYKIDKLPYSPPRGFMSNSIGI